MIFVTLILSRFTEYKCKITHLIFYIFYMIRLDVYIFQYNQKPWSPERLSAAQAPSLPSLLRPVCLVCVAAEACILIFWSGSVWRTLECVATTIPGDYHGRHWGRHGHNENAFAERFQTAVLLKFSGWNWCSNKHFSTFATLCYRHLWKHRNGVIFRDEAHTHRKCSG